VHQITVTDMAGGFFAAGDRLFGWHDVTLLVIVRARFSQLC